MSGTFGSRNMSKETALMELVERYLQAVRFLLPKKQRHDVDREISEELQSQIEEQQAERGRALDEDELASLLKRFGHPALLALRYQPERHLIGPAVFPLYWFALRFLLATLAVVHLLLPALFFIVSGEPAGRIVGLFGRFPGVVAPVFAWATLGFAILDTRVVWSTIERSLSSWQPQSLPPLVQQAVVKAPSATGLMLLALLNLWWLVGLRFPRVLLGPGAEYIGLGPGFHRLYIPMAVAGAAGIALGWLRLSRPQLLRPLWLAGLTVDALGLVVLYLLARGGDWFVPGEARVPGHDALVELANLGAHLGLSIAFVVGGIAFAWKYLTYVRAWQRPDEPAPPGRS